jgi:hypothetical protein
VSGGDNFTSAGLARARVAIVGLAAALLALAALAPVAGAVASEPAAEAGSSEAPEPMLVTFTTKSARISGPGAVVFVHCVGASFPSCEGTLSLRLGGAAHKVPYTIPAGARSTLIVPLGRVAARRGWRHPRSGVAVARTVQPLGGLLRSRRLLRLR